jgi:ribosomal protein L35AE/L33A
MTADEPDTRLYVNATFTSFRRNKRTLNPAQALLKIDGVHSRDEAHFYIGKKVAALQKGQGQGTPAELGHHHQASRKQRRRQGQVRQEPAADLPRHAGPGVPLPQHNLKRHIFRSTVGRRPDSEAQMSSICPHITVGLRQKKPRVYGLNQPMWSFILVICRLF